MSNKPPTADIAAWLKSTERGGDRAGGSSSMLLRRRFDTSLEKLWDACSDRHQLGKWFGDVSGDLREGALVSMEIGMPKKVTSRILRCDRPHHLLVTWSYGDPREHPDHVELRLNDDGDGTVLEVEHRSIDEVHGGAVWLGVGPGWENWVFRLSRMLMGDDSTRIPSEELDAHLASLWAAVVVRHASP